MATRELDCVLYCRIYKFAVFKLLTWSVSQSNTSFFFLWDHISRGLLGKTIRCSKEEMQEFSARKINALRFLGGIYIKLISNQIKTLQY